MCSIYYFKSSKIPASNLKLQSRLLYLQLEACHLQLLLLLFYQYVNELLVSNLALRPLEDGSPRFWLPASDNAGDNIVAPCWWPVVRTP
jgi:hypothetical protein